MNAYQTEAMNNYFQRVFDITFVDNPGYTLAPWGYVPEKKHIVVNGIHEGHKTKAKIYPSGYIKEVQITF